MKRVLILMMCFMLFLATNMPLYAVKGENEVNGLDSVIPNFTNISYAKVDLNIESDCIAHAQTTVTARNVDKLVIIMSLQRNENGNWKEIKTWTQTTYGTESVLYNTISVSRGYSYRVSSNVFVYLSSNLVESYACFSQIVIL